MRVEKRRQLRAALQAHLGGRTRPAEARERPELKVKPVVVLLDNLAAARAALKAAKAIKGRGRPGTIEYVEFLFAGPPPFESPDAWPKERVDQWLQATIEWVRKCAGPNAQIAAAYYHSDERSPHLHLLLVPINGKGRLSWKAVERGFAADPKAVGRRIMSSMQDSYQADVGKRFGLARGEVGSQRKHEPINRRKGLVERILEAPSKWSDRQRAEAALLKAEDTERERDRTVERAREAEAERDRARGAEASAEAERASAVEERAQAVLRATATEAERDELKRSRSSLLRDRDEARKARNTAQQALEREQADRAAETADWKAKLCYAAEHIFEARRKWQAANEEIQRLRAQTPPTQVAVDKARAQAQAVDTARVRAEAERDKANAGWNQAYNGYLAEKEQREAVVAKRDQDVAAARQQGYQQGQVSRDVEVKAAVNGAAKVQDTLDALREQIPADVDSARQEGVAAGRAQRDGEVTELQQTVEHLTTEHDEEIAALQQNVECLTTDLNAANQDREDLAGKVKNLTEHRDDLSQRLQKLQPLRVPPRPRGSGHISPNRIDQPEQDAPGRWTP